METEMLASVMTKVRHVEMQKRQIPKPKENEVLVKVKHCGVCGSDLHFYEEGKIGSNIFEEPLVLGHESAGEIIEVGKDVTNFKVGDVVALEPGIPCGKCEFCKSGRYNLCPDVAFMACPGYDGAFVEYVAWPEEMTFKLPEGMSTLEGALLEPLCVGLHAVEQADTNFLGKSAVVLGTGCIGLVTMMSLKMAGVTEIYVADVIQKRLDKAKELGATEIFKADEVDVVKAVMDLTGGRGVDLVFETAGNKVTTKQTVSLVKNGGTIVLVGMTPDSIVPFDISQLMWKEARLHTVFRYRNLYPIAIKAVSSGRIPLKDIVSHHYDFKDISEAMEYSVCNKPDVIKAVIEF